MTENKDNCGCGCIPLKEEKKKSDACASMPLKMAENKASCGCGCAPVKKEFQQEN